jgi:hypothetical protein
MYNPVFLPSKGVSFCPKLGVNVWFGPTLRVHLHRTLRVAPARPVGLDPRGEVGAEDPCCPAPAATAFSSAALFWVAALPRALRLEASKKNEHRTLSPVLPPHSLFTETRWPFEKLCVCISVCVTLGVET